MTWKKLLLMAYVTIGFASLATQGSSSGIVTLRSGHVRIIRDVRERQREDGSVLAGDDTVFRSVSDYLCSPPVEYIFPGTDPGRNYRSADVFDCRHIYDDSVGNYFVLDTQNPGKTKLSGENVT